jgi:hypothetical protein
MTTLAQARATLAPLNMTIRHADGEYRVAFKVLHNSPAAREDAEASAYYTDDIDDAVSTACAMRRYAADFGQRAIVNGALRITRFSDFA